MVPSRSWLAAVILTAVNLSAYADIRVLPAGEVPRDVRLQPLKDLDGYFPFSPPATPEAWAKRAEYVRTQIKVALGLLPEPTRTPLNPVIHGLVDRGDYTIEKVYFESMPGFFVTGNLYRPKNSNGRSPAVLCPHGHWPDGRFMEANDKAVQKELSTGAEKFENSARSPLQARCVQLARMGCVVFHYDMLGYADSVQISYDVAHKFAKQRPEMNTVESWGLYSPQAEGYAQSIMGLQTWNSIRALDFLSALPDVDSSRIGITGASGGGTQTMLHAAIDNRITAAFPAVMVSTAMQGGCTCENASLLRIGTGNIEFAALFAPKPMAMTSADDWTKELETKGFPELKRLWTMLGAPENASMTALTQFPHNYNGPSRAAMYSWFNKHLGLNLTAERLDERDFQRLTREELSVWNSEHPAPAGGPEFERRLLKWWREDIDKQVQTTATNDVRKSVGIALGVLQNEPSRGIFEARSNRRIGEYTATLGVLRDAAEQTELPLIRLSGDNAATTTVLWLDERGKQGLFADDDHLRPEVQSLLAAGANVVGVDLFHQGEFLRNGSPQALTRRVKNPREAAAYTFGYNHSVFAQRVQDVLSVLTFVRSSPDNTHRIGVMAPGFTGPIAAAARAVAPEGVGPVALGFSSFRFLNVSDLHDPMFQPALARYGDFPALLKLGGPTPVRLIETPKQNEANASEADLSNTVDWLKEALQLTVKP